MNKETESNRRGWDKLAAIHYRNYHIDKLLKGEPLLSDEIKREVGDVSGKSLVHLLCHIGTDTLSWALLGASVTGIDISPASLAYARELANRMGVNADFIESDILDAIGIVDQKFDVAFSSTGVLCWIPDITIYARTVRHLLKDDGFFYLLDGHPVRAMLFDEEGAYDEYAIKGNYFRSTPWEFDAIGDYTEPNVRFAIPSYEWHWTLGQVVTAFCDVGMRIEFLHEYPRYFYNGYTPCMMEDDETHLYPCVFSLRARAT